MLAMFLPSMVTVSILLVLLVTNLILPIIERYGDVYSVKVCIHLTIIMCILGMLFRF